MDRIDLMVDLETLGKGENPQLLQITAIPFDLTDETKDFSGMEFERFIDIGISDCINGDTLKWWLNTNRELLTDLVNKGNTAESVAVFDFIEYIQHLQHKIDGDTPVYLWGNGILFDNRILSEKCKQYDWAYPIYYRNDRDVRTINELAALKLGMSSAEDFRKSIENTGVEHNARDDVLYQIKCVQKAYQVLMGTKEDFWE